jgi:MFS family permease
MWYQRHECGLRMAIFFSAATAAGAFGGLLARAIMGMSGVGGKPGWAWIFIIEGIITFIVGTCPSPLKLAPTQRCCKQTI